MQILTLGGTGFIGSDVVHQLSEMGHEVTVFHRGQTQANLPPTVNSILGDYRNLPDFVDEFKHVAPQVVLDMIPATERDAETVMSIFKGIVDRVVAISSGDVYRAYGVLHRTEPGPVQPVPIKESAPLRQRLYPFRGSSLPPGVYEFLNREDYYKGFKVFALFSPVRSTNCIVASIMPSTRISKIKSEPCTSCRGTTIILTLSKYWCTCP